jgi:DNA mismatch repair protein MutL
MAYPMIHIKLTNDGKEIINSPITTNTKSNLSNIYPINIIKELLQLDYADENIEIMGFISKPSLTRSDKSYQTLIVNKRLVKSKIINDAIYEGYHGLLFNKRHPVFFLNITLDPREIDVNVHPSKKLVKFSKEKRIANSLTNSIRNLLIDNDLTPTLKAKEYDSSIRSFSDRLTQKVLEKEPSYEKKENDSSIKKQRYEVTDDTQSTFDTKHMINPKPNTSIEKTEIKYRILGQINKEYILVENKDGLIIIDQHAAMERTKYEVFIKDMKKGIVKTQTLLKEKMISFNVKQKAIVDRYKIFLLYLFSYLL